MCVCVCVCVCWTQKAHHSMRKVCCRSTKIRKCGGGDVCACMRARACVCVRAQGCIPSTTCLGLSGATRAWVGGIGLILCIKLANRRTKPAMSMPGASCSDTMSFSNRSSRLAASWTCAAQHPSCERDSYLMCTIRPISRCQSASRARYDQQLPTSCARYGWSHLEDKAA